VLLLELEAGFERVGIGLVDFVGKVGFLDPFSRRGDAQLRIARGDLFNCYDDLDGAPPEKDYWPPMNADERR
jgi:hypothetical protein